MSWRHHLLSEYAFDASLHGQESANATTTVPVAVTEVTVSAAPTRRHA